MYNKGRELDYVNSQFCMSKHTPWCVVRPVVDRDVVDAEDAGQVYPPGGVRFVLIRE